MKNFAKVDLALQIILLLVCVIPPLIVPLFIICWIITIPLLGAWQILSLVVYVYKKQLNTWHRTYIKVLMFVGIIMALSFAVFFQGTYFLIAWAVIGLLTAFFYLFVTIKTIKP
jgi:low temperature requirement protein LtrA